MQESHQGRGDQVLLSLSWPCSGPAGSSILFSGGPCSTKPCASTVYLLTRDPPRASLYPCCHVHPGICTSFRSSFLSVSVGLLFFSFLSFFLIHTLKKKINMKNDIYNFCDSHPLPSLHAMLGSPCPHLLPLLVREVSLLVLHILHVKGVSPCSFISF